MKKEKRFLIPEAEIISFTREDIITLSGEADVGEPKGDDSIWGNN